MVYFHVEYHHGPLELNLAREPWDMEHALCLWYMCAQDVGFWLFTSSLSMQSDILGIVGNVIQYFMERISTDLFKPSLQSLGKYPVYTKAHVKSHWVTKFMGESDIYEVFLNECLQKRSEIELLHRKFPGYSFLHFILHIIALLCSSKSIFSSLLKPT